eukprot:7323325-Pyramimonas_sp.AAC.1
MEAQAGSEVTRAPSTRGPEESSSQSPPHGGSTPVQGSRSEEVEPTHTPVLRCGTPRIPWETTRSHGRSRLQNARRS